MKRFHFKSAMVAGFIATLVMTVFMAWMGVCIVSALGTAMGYSGMMMYIMGGVVHLLIGLIFAFFYALIFEPLMQILPGFLSGTIYGFLIFLLAMVSMPHFMKALQTWGTEEEATMFQKTAYGQDPQDPQYPGSTPGPYQDQYPEQPDQGPYNDQNPYRQDRPDQDGRQSPKQGQEPDRYGDYYPKEPPKAQYVPSNYQAAKEKSTMKPWVVSLINHLIFGFVLGIFYYPKKREENS